MAGLITLKLIFNTAFYAHSSIFLTVSKMEISLFSNIFQHFPNHTKEKLENSDLDVYLAPVQKGEFTSSWY